MAKKLSEMSLEELWQLFPIFLTEHQDCWESWYADEKAALKKIIPQAVRISHIGSTAVNGIWAKPIIDILVEVPKECDLAAVKNLLTKNNSSIFSNEESVNFRIAENAILQRSEKSQSNKRVFEENSESKLSRNFSDNFDYYLCMSQNAGRISFNKGYTENGFAEKIFHLHLRYVGDNDELYFRDYLIAHPDVAREYEKMKLALWKKFEHDRDGYTKAKTKFVQKYTNEAKLKFPADLIF